MTATTIPRNGPAADVPTAFGVELRAVVRYELALLGRDPGPFVVLIAMPFVLTSFLQDAYGPILELEGHTGARGAAQAVPGMAVMFSWFLVGFVALSYFRDHNWGMWERFRVVVSHPAAIILGKGLPLLALSVMQQVTLLVAGDLVFGLDLGGEVAPLLAITWVLGVCVSALGLALVAVCRTMQQVYAVANVGSLVLSGLGGALVPVSALPGWAAAVAPASPAYWAMQAYRGVLLEGAGLPELGRPLGVLALFTVGACAVAARLFRFDSEKVAAWE